jgi:putative peptide zinc metalloprotease protein
VIFMLMTAGAYFVTGFEPLLLLIPLQHIEIVHQLLPFLRLDGYYIVSDLTGVPDILSRIKPTLKSLVPGVETDPRVQELKPWARTVVALYVLLLIPVLIALFLLMAFAAPRVLATSWDALGMTWQRVHHSIERRDEVSSLVSLLQLALTTLTPVALALALAGAARRVSSGVWGWTEPRPRTRLFLVAVASATATALFVNWWAVGAYRPIAVGERGTISARAFDPRPGVGRESHDRPVPPRLQRPLSDSNSVPQRSGAEPTIPRMQQSVNPPTRRAGETTLLPGVATTEPDPGAEWTTSVEAPTETETATTPTDMTSPSTTTPTTTTP